jgi:hypothetical protein
VRRLMWEITGRTTLSDIAYGGVLGMLYGICWTLIYALITSDPSVAMFVPIGLGVGLFVGFMWGATLGLLHSLALIVLMYLSWTQARSAPNSVATAIITLLVVATGFFIIGRLPFLSPFVNISSDPSSLLVVPGCIATLALLHVSWHVRRYIEAEVRALRAFQIQATAQQKGV